MRGRNDVSGFIRSFAGDDRSIVDYLIEEVLQHQAAALRDFLLRSAVLDRMTGPLCDAVTGRDEKAIINEVERGEDYLKAKFETALNDGHLSGETRSAVESCYQSVREGHDQMSHLKHGMEASS